MLESVRRFAEEITRCGDFRARSLIGNGNRNFPGKVFTWSSKTSAPYPNCYPHETRWAMQEEEKLVP